MKKSRLLKKNEKKVRILEEDGAMFLIIDCIKETIESIIHTGEEKSEQYYLVPMRSGEYVIKISVICEEMEKQVVQDFVVKVK